EPAPLGSHAEALDAAAAEAGAAVREHAAGEARGPDHGLVDLGVLHRIGLRFHRADLHRLLAGQVARGLQRVDAHVHQRTATGQRVLQPPLVGAADVDRKARLHDHGRAEHAFAREPDALEVVRIVPAAVRGAEQPAGVAAGVDHPLAALDRDFQRLLAEHVLARLRRADRVPGMERVRGGHVDDVDARIVRHAVHVVVAVDAAVGNAVLRLEPGYARWRTADQARQPAVPGLLQRRRDLVLAQAAETAQGDAERARRAPSPDAAVRFGHGGSPLQVLRAPGTASRRRIVPAPPSWRNVRASGRPRHGSRVAMVADASIAAARAALQREAGHAR